MSCTYCPYCSPHKLGLASNQKVQLVKKEGKSCIERANYAPRKYLPPPSKMHGITFHFWKLRLFPDRIELGSW